MAGRDTPENRNGSEPGHPADGGENVSVRVRPMLRRGPGRLAVALLTLGVAACGDEGPEAAPTTGTPPPSVAGAAPDARTDLAGRAAAAQDKAYAALYRLDDGGGPRDVVATSGADGSWRVDVSRGVHGGTTDVSIVSTGAGVFQCTVATAANPAPPTCARVAEPGRRVPARYSPRVERLFRPALAVFTDRQSALTVTEVQPLSGAKGSCYSIDSISASLDAPVDVGIYCYAEDGVLTAARIGFGVLSLVSQVPGPPSVPLPGAEAGSPMTTASPPAPPPPTLPPAPASPDAPA